MFQIRLPSSYTLPTQVAAFVDSSFVMWVPGGKTAPQKAAAVAAAAKRVGARSLPFLGVVNSVSTTNKMSLERKLTRSTVALHHCNPPPSPDQVLMAYCTIGVGCFWPVDLAFF